MASGMNWQALQTAQTMLALHQGSEDIARIGQHELPYEAATTSMSHVASLSNDGTDAPEAFEATKKAEAIKAYLARKSSKS